jgi:large subunit ribosomal protein L1
MSKLPKRKKAWDKLREHNKNYPVADALKLIKQAATAKFDEAVDVAINLGIDPTKSDQTVRGSVVLPAGTGKKVRIAVFAQGDKVKAAKDAGADIVGMDDLAESIKAGKLDFDIVIASPDTMRVVGQLGQILGPRGLMPNPKVGEERARWPGSVPRRQGGHRPVLDRARLVHAGAAARQSRGAGRRGEQVEALQRKGHLSAQGVRVLDHGTGRAGRRGKPERRRRRAALTNMGISRRAAGSRTLGQRAAGTARGGLSKTVGTERFNRRETCRTSFRPTQMANPRYRSCLNARSPWAPQVRVTRGFDKWR